MKVRFENHGDLIIDRLGYIRVEVPRGAGPLSTEIDLPDTDEAKRFVLNLTTKNRALVAILVDDSVGASAPADDHGNLENDKNPDGFEAFKVKVKSVSKGGAWWTIEIDGRPAPIKLRGAETEEDAIKLAFEECMEETNG